MKHSPKLTAALSFLLVSSTYGQSHRAATLSDNDIELEVQQALSDSAFNGSSIQSAVSAGVVKLYGNVRNNDEKTLAEAKITNLRGVKSINDLLTVIDRTVAPVASSTPAPAAPKTITVPQGVTIPIRLRGEIDTKTAAAGDTFTGTTAANISHAGTVVIPTGTPVTGRVVEAKSAGRLSGAAVLSVELVSLKLSAPGGQPQDVSIVTKPLSNKSQGNGTGTATKTAGGAGLGAAIGAIAGGGRGAGIGAASGGVVGLGASALTPGKQIDLKPETLLQFETNAAFDVPTTAPTTTAASSALAVRSNHSADAAASIPTQNDPYTFDIVGLKLGMTAKEASAAISSRVPQVSKAGPEPGDARFTPKARYTQAFSANGPQFKVLVTFTESYPFNPQRPEQLTGIFYTAITPTVADRDRFEQAVLTKYGEPVRYSKGVSAAWCNVGTLNSPGVYICAPNSPNLLLKGSELILGDNGPAQRERAAWNAQTAGTPPI